MAMPQCGLLQMHIEPGGHSDTCPVCPIEPRSSSDPYVPFHECGLKAPALGTLPVHQCYHGELEYG
eukprot:6442253-Amphidinium_carterae.1